MGRALADHATAWLRDAGMRVAVIGTGGDPGHAPARRLYDTFVPADRFVHYERDLPSDDGADPATTNRP